MNARRMVHDNIDYNANYLKKSLTFGTFCAIVIKELEFYETLHFIRY